MAKSISKDIKEQLWDKYFTADVGRTKCPLNCGRDIRQSSFDAGHIISRHNGGGDNIDNLMPICRTCNGSMSTKNMTDYIAEYKITPLCEIKQPTSEVVVPRIVKDVKQKSKLDVFFDELSYAMIEKKYNVIGLTGLLMKFRVKFYNPKRKPRSLGYTVDNMFWQFYNDNLPGLLYRTELPSSWDQYDCGKYILADILNHIKDHRKDIKLTDDELYDVILHIDKKVMAYMRLRYAQL